MSKKKKYLTFQQAVEAAKRGAVIAAVMDGLPQQLWRKLVYTKIAGKAFLLAEENGTVVDLTVAMVSEQRWVVVEEQMVMVSIPEFIIRGVYSVSRAFNNTRPSDPNVRIERLRVLAEALWHFTNPKSK